MLTTLALAPFSALYGATMRARAALYHYGLLDSARVEVPVISVGNITTGGTGKTPLVEWVARALASEGLRVCVLTRGYGRKDESVRVVVSDGERILADAREGGDEPRLLAEALAGSASVVSCADRLGAARWAIKNLRAEVFVLDDGFQHLRLARDLDIVTVDATTPWGGGHLLPRGRLRERLPALRRAGCIILTRAELANDIESLRAEAERFSGGRAPVLEARVLTTRIRSLHPANDDVFDESAAGPFAAFCATGNPRAFFANLVGNGRELSYTRAFPDHHVYSQDDLDAVAHAALRAGARALFTTAKDAVKLRELRPALTTYVVEIELEIRDEGRLIKLLREAVARRATD